MYLATLTNLLEELEVASRKPNSMANHPKGTPQVMASVAFGQVSLAQLIPEFIKLYKDIHLELPLTDANTEAHF